MMSNNGGLWKKELLTLKRHRQEKMAALTPGKHEDTFYRDNREKYACGGVLVRWRMNARVKSFLLWEGLLPLVASPTH